MTLSRIFYSVLGFVVIFVDSYFLCCCITSLEPTPPISHNIPQWWMMMMDDSLNSSPNIYRFRFNLCALFDDGKQIICPQQGLCIVLLRSEKYYSSQADTFVERAAAALQVVCSSTQHTAAAGQRGSAPRSVLLGWSCRHCDVLRTLRRHKSSSSEVLRDKSMKKEWSVCEGVYISSSFPPWLPHSDCMWPVARMMQSCHTVILTLFWSQT